MSTSFADVVDAVNSTTRYKSPNGVKCHFVKLNDGWGVKVYRDKEERDSCHEFQGQVAGLGLAPLVGDMFAFPSKDDGDNDYTAYCYVSERVVRLMADDVYPEYGTPERTKFLDDRRAVINNIKITIKEKLHRELEDCHDHNMGYLADGRFVAIDFGNN